MTKGPIYLGMDLFILDSLVVILFFDKWPAWGWEFGTQITPRGWIFWYMIFYDRYFTKIEWVCVALLGLKASDSGWSGQKEDICPSIKKSMSNAINALRFRQFWTSLDYFEQLWINSNKAVPGELLTLPIQSYVEYSPVLCTIFSDLLKCFFDN